jgi:pimeloyl-ACP methyl ester carboxylesterase
MTDYWLDGFDWRAVEKRLNLLPHFAADVEGERIHFNHARGDGSKAPLLLLHGWPGSFIELERLIGPLTADGHDVIVPSLPGFAFSNPITGIIGPRRADDLMHVLMNRLFGDVRYIVQGGDWGAHIASWMETLAYFLFVTRADINERIRRYASVLTDLVGGDWKGKSIELNKDDKAAFRKDLDGPIYQITRVRLPLLLRLDAELSSGGATYSHDVVSVEHVLPQTPDAASQWLKDFPDVVIREGWTHRLANLMLLTLRKHIQASNWDFTTKKERYFSESGGVSPFVITTQVLGEKAWAPYILDARQKALLAKLYATWDIQPEAQP